MAVSLAGDFENIHLRYGNEVVAGAGTSLAGLCNFAKKWQLSGLEFAWGIPGSVGGAAFMNAGAYGEEMKDVVLSCTHMNPDGTIETYTAEQLDFAYRHSVYQKSHGIVLSVAFQLKKGDKQEIKAKMDDLMGRRKEKQPLEYPSAGSTFKRPEGYFAGKLIQDAGLRGYQVGGAQVSEKHCGFVINKENATATDVVNLIHDVQRIVYEKFQVQLDTEVKFLGEF